MALLAIWPPLVLLAAALSLAGAPLHFSLRLLGLLFALILLGDIAARLRDYSRLVGLLSQQPSRLARQVSRHKRSWCQRTTLVWAARKALGARGRRLVAAAYAARGYRWFHVFPDGALSVRSTFLNLRFWHSLLTGTRDDPG